MIGLGGGRDGASLVIVVDGGCGASVARGVGGTKLGNPMEPIVGTMLGGTMLYRDEPAGGSFEEAATARDV